MVNGTMSIYTYDVNWNCINMMCVDKQNNVCLRQLVTYRKIMCVYAIFLFQQLLCLFTLYKVVQEPLTL